MIRANLRLFKRFATHKSTPPASTPKPNKSTSDIKVFAKNTEESYRAELQTWADAHRWDNMSPGQKVVYATQQTSYTAAIVAGIVITGGLMYTLGKELFDGTGLFGMGGAGSVYKMALQRVNEDERVLNMIGDHVKGYDETRRRGHWRRKLDVFQDENTGKKTAFMKFNVFGELSTGTVNVWLQESPNGDWEYKHLNVEIPASGKRIVVVDSRVQQ